LKHQTAADNRTLDGERSSSVSYELLRESSASSSSSNDSRGSCEKNRKKALTSKIGEMKTMRLIAINLILRLTVA